MVELLTASLDVPIVRQLTQDALERRAVVILEAEGTGKFARADLAGLPADEGENVFFRRKRARGCGLVVPGDCDPLIS